MTYRQFGVMVPKTLILVHFGDSLQRGESQPVIRNGLAREGILIFWSQDAMVAGYLGVVVPWYYDVLVP